MFSRKNLKLFDTVFKHITSINVVPITWSSAKFEFQVTKGWKLIPARFCTFLFFMYTIYLILRLIDIGKHSNSIKLEDLIHSGYILSFSFGTICSVNNLREKKGIVNFLNLSLHYYRNVRSTSCSSVESYPIQKILKSLLIVPYTHSTLITSLYFLRPTTSWHLFSIIEPYLSQSSWYKTVLIGYGILLFFASIAVWRIIQLSIVSMLIHWFGTSDVLKDLMRIPASRPLSYASSSGSAVIHVQPNNNVKSPPSIPESINCGLGDYKSLQILNIGFNACFAKLAFSSFTIFLITMLVLSYHVLIRFHRTLNPLIIMVILNLTTFFLAIIVKIFPISAKVYTLSCSYHRYLNDGIAEMIKKHYDSNKLLVPDTSENNNQEIPVLEQISCQQQQQVNNNELDSEIILFKKQIRSFHSMKIKVGSIGFMNRQTCYRVYGFIVYWTFKSILLLKSKG